MTGDGGNAADLTTVLDRCDAFMRKLVRCVARGRGDFQEDLLQEARVAIWRALEKGRPLEDDFRYIALSAMRGEARKLYRHERRMVSLDAIVAAQEARAIEEEQDAA